MRCHCDRQARIVVERTTWDGCRTGTLQTSLRHRGRLARRMPVVVTRREATLGQDNTRRAPKSRRRLYALLAAAFLGMNAVRSQRCVCCDAKTFCYGDSHVCQMVAVPRHIAQLMQRKRRGGPDENLRRLWGATVNLLA